MTTISKVLLFECVFVFTFQADHLHDKPFRDLRHVEEYGESTNSSLNYLLLQCQGGFTVWNHLRSCISATVNAFCSYTQWCNYSGGGVHGPTMGHPLAPPPPILIVHNKCDWEKNPVGPPPHEGLAPQKINTQLCHCLYFSYLVLQKVRG